VAAANLPALEVAGMTLGLREAVIALISLVAIYMAFVLLRMWWLRQKKAAAINESSTMPEELPVLTEQEPLPAGEPSWEKTAGGLAEQMLRQGLEQEVAQLRDEVDAVRGELAALREDMLQELSHLRASQTVSPIYGDAMQMASAGYDAAMIAERCGIARAEAELVVALAKSQGQ